MSYKTVLIFLTISLFISCDPMSQFLIRANDENIKVDIFPSIESIYCKEPISSEVCNNAIKHNIGNKINGSSYFLKKNEAIEIYGKIGLKIDPIKFPYDSVKIFYKNDSLIYKGKESIIKNFIEETKLGRKTYVLKL